MRNMFAQVLGRSPVGPIEKHIDEVNKAAIALDEMNVAAQQGLWEDALASREEIEQINLAANEIRRELRLNLPSTFLMPVAREDLLELLDGQDKILRRINDVAGLIIGRRIQLPEALANAFHDLIECTVAAVRQTRQSVKELDELFEVGFRGREVEIVEKMLSTLMDIEREHDRLQGVMREQLFAMEKELHPVDAVFLYRLIDWVGAIAERCARAGDLLERLLAR